MFHIARILGTQTKGVSLNNNSLAAICLVVYKPFPLVDDLTIRLEGIDKFGVGFEIAEDVET